MSDISLHGLGFVLCALATCAAGVLGLVVRLVVARVRREPRWLGAAWGPVASLAVGGAALGATDVIVATAGGRGADAWCALVPLTAAGAWVAVEVFRRAGR